MSTSRIGTLGGSTVGKHDSANEEPEEIGRTPNRAGAPTPELRGSLAEIKGQAQFVLYLADQIEESLEQLVQEADACHGAFLCKLLSMYSNQLESKHQGLGEKIAETCQEVYVTVREHEMA
jgi:hypothetical protein